MCFGEKVWYKQLREGKERKDKFCTEWHEGIWLGHTRNSNEHIIGLSDGAVKAYSIRRHEHSERWNGGLIRGLRGTPQQPDPTKPGLYIPIRVNFEPVPEGVECLPITTEAQPRQIRRMKITSNLLAKYGYTIDCEINTKRHMAGSLSMAHAGKNTGGSQFFLVHDAQPHLDGVHTVFGHTSNMDVVLALKNGSRIISVKIIDTH